MTVKMVIDGDCRLVIRSGVGKVDGKPWKYGNLEFMGGSMRIPESALGSAIEGSGKRAEIAGEIRPADYGVLFSATSLLAIK